MEVDMNSARLYHIVMSVKCRDETNQIWRNSYSTSPRLKRFRSNSEELREVANWLRYRTDKRAYPDIKIDSITSYQVAEFRRIRKDPSFIMPTKPTVIRTHNEKALLQHEAKMSFVVPKKQQIVWYSKNKKSTCLESVGKIVGKNLTSIYQANHFSPYDKGALGKCVEIALGISPNQHSKMDTPEGEIKSMQLKPDGLTPKDHVATASFSLDPKSSSIITQELLRATPFFSSSLWEKIKLLFLIGIDTSVEGSAIVKRAAYINLKDPDFADILSGMEADWNYLSECLINGEKPNRGQFSTFVFGPKGGVNNRGVGRSLYLHNLIVKEMFIRGISL